MKIKNPKGWIPAGAECERASALLSDGAFRVYMHIYIKAFRSTGVYICSYDQLARELDRSKRSVAEYGAELRKKGVCSIRPAVNQYSSSEFEICDGFWPYDRSVRKPTSHPDQFIQAVQRILEERPCIRTCFGSAEQAFARLLCSTNISLEQIQHAVNLACARKYVSLVNRRDQQIIKSFLYFRETIEEVAHAEVPPYERKLAEIHLARVEREWLKLSP